MGPPGRRPVEPNAGRDDIHYDRHCGHLLVVAAAVGVVPTYLHHCVCAGAAACASAHGAVTAAVANGTSRSISVNEILNLDASISTDADQLPLTYQVFK